MLFFHPQVTIGSLSNGVFERHTSTGSEVFFILKHLDAPKFVFLSVLTIIETSCPKKWAKPLSKNEKKPLLVDVRRSKTSLLKFTNIFNQGWEKGFQHNYLPTDASVK